MIRVPVIRLNCVKCQAEAQWLQYNIILPCGQSDKSCKAVYRIVFLTSVLFILSCRKKYDLRYVDLSYLESNFLYSTWQIVIIIGFILRFEIASFRKLNILSTRWGWVWISQNISIIPMFKQGKKSNFLPNFCSQLKNVNFSEYLSTPDVKEHRISYNFYLDIFSSPTRHFDPNFGWNLTHINFLQKMQNRSLLSLGSFALHI